MNRLLILKKLAFSMLIVVIFLLLMSFWGFYSAIYPFKITSSVTPAMLGVKAESIEFKTHDNILIRGWFIPSKKIKTNTIILLHGYGADKGDLLRSRLFLLEHFNLLFIDFRYFGQSGGTYSTAGLSETADVEGAIQFLHTKGIHEVGIWGISMGAAVALMTAPDKKEIKAIVSESSYANLKLMSANYFRLPGVQVLLGKLMQWWGYLILGYDINEISPMMAAKKLTIPILLIHSKSDELIPIVHHELLQDVLKKNPKVELLIVDQVPHGGLTAEMKKKIEAFFIKHL